MPSQTLLGDASSLVGRFHTKGKWVYGVVVEVVLTKTSTDGWFGRCDLRTTILPLFRSLELSTVHLHRLPPSALDLDVNFAFLLDNTETLYADT